MKGSRCHFLACVILIPPGGGGDGEGAEMSQNPRPWMESDR